MLNKRIFIVMFLLVFLLLVGCITSAPPVDENQAPVIVSVPTTNAKVGVGYIYNVGATDPDNDILTYSLTIYPIGMVINSNTGLITWTPTSSGSFGVTVKVSDGELSVTQSFNILVEVVEDPCVPPCPTPDPPTPPITLIGIDASPDPISLPRDSGTEQLTVLALYSDESTIDITLDCVYYVPLYYADIVSVDIAGLVSAEECSGEATITVFYTPKVIRGLIL